MYLPVCDAHRLGSSCELGTLEHRLSCEKLGHFQVGPGEGFDVQRRQGAIAHLVHAWGRGSSGIHASVANTLQGQMQRTHRNRVGVPALLVNEAAQCMYVIKFVMQRLFYIGLLMQC